MTKRFEQIGNVFETFSDASMRVNGVKIQPTWCWSDTYRKMVRAEMTKVRPDPYDQARTYQRWYKAKFGKPYDGPGYVSAFA